jgi:hypothetical protein
LQALGALALHKVSSLIFKKAMIKPSLVLISGSMGVLHLIWVSDEDSSKHLMFPFDPCPPIVTGLSRISVEKCLPVIVNRVPPLLDPSTGEKLVISPITLRLRAVQSNAPSVFVLTFNL